MFSNLFSNDEISLLISCCTCGCGCDCDPVGAAGKGREGGSKGVSGTTAANFSSASS